MNELMLSIRPKYCCPIVLGKKTIEVRRDLPKRRQPPFKCFMYKTRYPHGFFSKMANDLYGGGKVVGEFICDKIDVYTYGDLSIPMPYSSLEHVKGYWISVGQLAESYLSYRELYEYGRGETLYGWHVSELKIYTTPKDLSDFGLKRAPQSWCYVKERNFENEPTNSSLF